MPDIVSLEKIVGDVEIDSTAVIASTITGDQLKMPDIVSVENIVGDKEIDSTAVIASTTTGDQLKMPDIVSLENIVGDKEIDSTAVIASTTTGDQEETNQTKSTIKDKPENSIPRGQPKSGRFWKTPKTKASTLIHTRGLRRGSTFEKKEKLRAELKHIKELSRAKLAEKKQAKEDQKERRRQNLKRQEENRKKSEIVQVIRNPAKIKRMRRKQLRQIEKRDTTNM